MLAGLLEDAYAASDIARDVACDIGDDGAEEKVEDMTGEDKGDAGPTISEQAARQFWAGTRRCLP